MHNTHTRQELLLNTGAGYCRRQWCQKKDDSARNRPLPAEEQLQQLCWDGMLPEMLPEICLRENSKPLILWELNSLQRLLHLRFGGMQEALDPHWSLHPYLIADHLHLN